MRAATPHDSPYYERNRAAHRARWGFAPPEHSSPEVNVESVPARPGAALPSPSWPEGMLLSTRLRTTAGTSIALHSERAPLREAEAWCRAVLADTPPTDVVVVGAGLGYAIDVLHAGPDTRVLAVEPEPALVPWLLARRDWTPLIEAGRLMVVTVPAGDAAPHIWKFFQQTRHAVPPMLVHPVIGRERSAAAVEAGTLVAKAVQGARANAAARRRFEAPYLLNTIANLHHVVRARRLDACAALARGRPVVLAGAGPSLNRNIDDLRPYRDRVVLVATDTALKPLEDAGLAPDFVVAVDPGEMNARHLACAQPGSRTTLVAEASVHPSAFVPFGDRVVTFRVADHAPWPWLRSRGIDPGCLRAWGSVLTTAFDFALLLGGDPIVFIGADLAYTGGQPYCRGTVFEDDWAEAARTEGTDLTEVWEQLIAPKAINADDLHGRATRTAPHLVEFRDWIVAASRSAASNADGSRSISVVNATGAGILHGSGVTLLSLRDALATGAQVAPPVHAGTGPASTPLPALDATDAHLLSQALTRGADFPPTADLPLGGTAFMRRPRSERRRATRRLRVLRQTDHERWSRPDNLDVSWERLPLAAAPLIPPGARVLDLGAGLEALERHLPASATYVPADVARLSARTMVVDVNAGQFPDGSYDVVTMLGLLELVHDVPALLRTAAGAAPTLVASYCTVTRWNRDRRLEKGWFNDLTLSDLLDTFQATGWVVAWAGRLDAFEFFDQWVFACCRPTTQAPSPRLDVCPPMLDVKRHPTESRIAVEQELADQADMGRLDLFLRELPGGLRLRPWVLCRRLPERPRDVVEEEGCAGLQQVLEEHGGRCVEMKRVPAIEIHEVEDRGVARRQPLLQQARERPGVAVVRSPRVAQSLHIREPQIAQVFAQRGDRVLEVEQIQLATIVEQLTHRERGGADAHPDLRDDRIRNVRQQRA